jgi:hypothetical protein
MAPTPSLIPTAPGMVVIEANTVSLP